MNIIAIVGRPNVGKSTLFNRLIGRREAIVQEEPGITRDRIYGTTDWAGIHFTIIDTGGIVPESDDIFDKAIREQATIAIEEADSIIFVVDGRAGITTMDEEIADVLRRSGKHIVLAVNKCDNHEMDANAHEFFSLGVGNVYSFSALSGRSLGDLLDDATEPLKGRGEPVEDERLKIAIVGRPNAGKSSLVNALLGKDRMIVTPIAGTTRDAIDSVIKFYGNEMVLIDTAGLRRRTRIKENVEMFSVIRTQRAIERCDVAIVIIDAERGLDMQDKHILADIYEKRKGLIIAINKWDLIEKDSKTADNLTKKIHEELKTLDFVPIVYISAMTKQRISKLLELAQEIQTRRSTRISTSKLNNTILEDIENTPPPAISARDLRINYITQVKTNPPVFAFFSNHPELMPESYKRFLERKLREHFDFVGVPLTMVFKRKNTKREYN